MKTLIFLITTLLVFGCTLSPKSKHLTGKWEIYKIKKPDQSAKEKRRKYLELGEDGTLKGGNIGQEPDKFGTWEFDKKTKIMTLESSGGNKDDGDYKIEELTKQELILMRDSIYIYLEKVD